MALVSPRRRARGVVWPKVAIVVVLCAIVGATSFQSNENLSSLTARTQPAPGGADGTEHASAKATAAGHGSTQEAGGAATDRQPDGTAGAEPDGDASAEAAESSGDAAAQSASDSKAKPLLYFDVGHAYHHLPVCPPGWERPGFACDASPCPVPWEYTEDKGKADVGGLDGTRCWCLAGRWRLQSVPPHRCATAPPPRAVLFNTLDGMTGWGDAGSQRPGQWVVLYAMESGQYYPAIYTAKEHGANITAGARRCWCCCSPVLPARARDSCGKTEQAHRPFARRPPPADYRLDSDVVVPYYSRWEYANLSVMPVPFSEKRQVCGLCDRENDGSAHRLVQPGRPRRMV